jgi:DnaJ like chaperone protein
MRWRGKVIGGAIGAILGPGPVGSALGAALGALLGHQFDQPGRDADDEVTGAGGDPRLVSAIFFRSAFAVMGCIAKADGRVSEREIQAARAVMRQMRLSPDQVQAAIRFFGEGKQPGFALQRVVEELHRVCGRRHDLLRMFVEIQMRAVLEGSDLQGTARGLVLGVGRRLGLSALELVHMEGVLRLQRGRFGARGGQGAAANAGRLDDAYSVLEVRASVSDAEVTRAYRRAMSRHHPDKLVANGLPESMLELAKEKTQQVKQAYEVIKRHRGIG